MKFFLLLILCSSAFAQNVNPSILTCNGNYSDYQNPELRNLPFQGGVIRIAKDSVFLSGFVGFTNTQERQFHIFNSTDSFIEFVDLKNQNYTGSLGRYSGQFFLNEFRDGSRSKLHKLADGNCTLKERLF